MDSRQQAGQTSQTSQDNPAGQTDQTQVVAPPAQNAPVPAPLPTTAKFKEQASFSGVPFTDVQGKQLDTVAGINVAEAEKIAKEEGDEYWENYAREIELEKEVLEMGGVEKVESGEVKVPEQVAKEMGIEPTVGPQTPMGKVTDFTVRGVTLTDDQITSGQQKPVSTGWRWLVEWFIFQLLRAHYLVKKVRGRIFRVKGQAATSGLVTSANS